MHPKTLIVIPVFNEAQNLNELLGSLEPFKEDVVFFDDGSTDTSLSIIQDYGYQYYSIKDNKGLDEVYRLAFEMAGYLKAKQLIFMDGDNQHQPSDLPAFLDATSRRAFVMGQRFYLANLHIVPACKLASNLFASLITAQVLGVALPDVACGFRGFNLERIQANKLILNVQSGYGVIYSLLFQLLHEGIVPYYIPIEPIYSDSNIALGTRYAEFNALIKALEPYGLPKPQVQQLLFNPRSRPTNFSLGNYKFSLMPYTESLMRLEMLEGVAESYYKSYELY